MSALPPFKHIADEEDEEEEVPLLHHTYQIAFGTTTTEKGR